MKSLPNSISVPKLKGYPLCSIDGEWLFEENYRKEKFKKEYNIEIDENDFEEVIKVLKEISKFKKPNPYYAIFLMDGDNMGKWLKGKLMPKIKDFIHEKVVDSLLEYSEEKDKQKLQELLCSRHPMSASFHFAFSRRLSNFALEDVRKTVEEDFYGKLVYAGGDDVLAFLPVDEVLKCAYKLQGKFKEILGDKASMSAGIVIVHYKYPLSMALKKVREAEQIAKKDYGKNVFCIYYIAHSGSERKTGGRWDLYEFFEDLICKFKNDKISSRFGYEVLEVVESLYTDENKDKVNEILEIEIRRIFRRKEGAKELRNFEDKIIEVFGNFNGRPQDFANMFIVAKQIADSVN